MAESFSPGASQAPIDDEDLLSQAIPIDQIEEPEPDDVELPTEAAAIRKIRSTEHDRAHQHQDHWRRKTSVTGDGATHVKTFVSKLRPDAVQYMDDQINAWLDEHPEYEVKFATTTVGYLMGKNTEHAILVNVWV